MRTQVADTELVELIYASLLGESTWQAFLDRLSQAAPGCWSVMHSNSKSSEEAAVSLVSGRSPGDVADYPTYYHGISPWAPHCHARPAGKATIVENYVPGHVLERSEFYSDFLRRIETRSAIGIGVDSDDGGSLIISLMTPNAAEERILPLAAQKSRSSGNPDPGRAVGAPSVVIQKSRSSGNIHPIAVPLAWSVVIQMERIAPHLRRASEFYRRTSFAAHTNELGATFFDALDMGMVIVGTGRRIRTCSDVARSMLGPDVGLDPLGRIRLSDQMAQSVLNAMLLRAYDGPRHQRLLVGKTLVTLIRMEGERERSFFEGPGVCLTMEFLGSGRFLDIEQFAKAYGLTPSEIRVLEGLVRGSTLNEIAHQAHRSRETIRSQLKSLCIKTGARGQADVLRMAAGMKV